MKSTVKNKYDSYIIICITLFFVFGCSPEKRIDRILKRNPDLFQTTIKDSFTIKSSQVFDTTFVASKTDTIFFKDVVIIKKDSLISVIYKTAPCTTYVKYTIYQPKETILKETTKEEKRNNFFYKLIILFFVIGTVFSALNRFVNG